MHEGCSIKDKERKQENGILPLFVKCKTVAVTNLQLALHALFIYRVYVDSTGWICLGGSFAEALTPGISDHSPILVRVMESPKYKLQIFQSLGRSSQLQTDCPRRVED